MTEAESRARLPQAKNSMDCRSHQKLGEGTGRCSLRASRPGENGPLLFKPFDVWSFVTGALGNEHTSHGFHLLSVTPP